MTGCSLARTMSQPDVAVRAMPDAVAAHPAARRGPSRGWGRRAGRAGCSSGTSAPSRVSETWRSARATSSGRWVTTTTVRRSPRSASRSWTRLGGVGVEVRGRLVDEQHRRGREGRPGQGDAGPLAGRQPEPVVAERRRQGVGQAGDETLEADEAQGVPEGLVVGVVAEGEGVAQRAGREERALRDEVGAAGAHGTGIRAAQPGRELEEGRLADPRRAGDGGEARPGIQGHVDEHGACAPG